MGVSRRTILKYGLGGAGILALGGIGLSLRPTRSVEPQTLLRVFSPQEYSILAAVADTILSGTDGYPSARDVQIAERIDEALVACHPGLQKEFKQILGLLESAVAGFVLGGRTSTFTALSPEDRWAVLDSWRRARIRVFRTAFKAIHGLVTASYYSAPQVHARVGYPGVPPWVTAVRLAGLGSSTETPPGGAAAPGSQPKPATEANEANENTEEER
jgi:hypothetical protein